MPLKQIKFGTSGWRGVIAEDFTFEGVRAAAAAIADYLRRENRNNPRLVIGYDTRFFSDEFAREAAAVLTQRGIHCYLCEAPAPTPAIAHEILRAKADGGINFTASHNPAEYNGLKFSTSDGGAALKGVTQKIETLAARHLENGVKEKPADESKLETIDPSPAYLESLSQKVDLDLLKHAGLRIAFDPLFGAASGYLDGFLTRHGLEVFSIHTNRDVLFGGHPPEPSDEILTDLKALVLAKQATVGLACDGDADRFGIVDRDGTFVDPNHILALLVDYLFEAPGDSPRQRRGWPRAVARSIATTHMMDAVARHHGAVLHETTVGFKFIAELIKAGKITLGGEESAGLSIFGHLPEKDGILACLLVAEMVARRGTSLTEQLQALFKKVGPYYPVRANLHLEPPAHQRATERIAQDPDSFDGRKVFRIDRTDGLKVFLEEDAWVLMRPSGTEPAIRCYCESHSEEETQALVQSAKKFLLE